MRTFFTEDNNENEVMRNWSIKIILGVVVLAVSLSQGFAADNTLRKTLEGVWEAHIQACRTGREAEVAKTMTASRFAEIKNRLASDGRSFSPEMFQDRAKDDSEITKEKFVTLLEKGPTAGLVYVQDVKWKDANGKPYIWKDSNGKSHIQFVFVKFVKDESGWKVDGMVSMSEPRKDDAESVFDASKLPEGCRIDGVIPVVPKLLPIAEVGGGLFTVSSSSYKIQMTVNGFEQHEFLAKQSGGYPIYGGLHKGVNKIVLTCTKTEKDGKDKPEVTVLRRVAGKRPEECFKYEPKDSVGIEGAHEFTFVIKE